MLKKLSLYSISTVFLCVVSVINNGIAQNAFGSNNLAVVVAAASANNTTASVVEINKTSGAQSAIQTISIPGTGPNAIRVSGSATSTLYAANTNDGSLFCFTGHNVDGNTTSNANTLNPRAVVTVNPSGTVAIQSTYTGVSGNQTRGATSINNTNWFIGDQGGFYTNSATAASPTGNVRGIKPFGGIVYAFTSTTTAPPVGIISATTGGTYTALTGLANGSTGAQDFYLVSSGSNGSAYDVLYILSSTSATAGTIAKYSLVSGSWTSNGTYTTTFGGFGMAAEKSSTGANIFITTGTGATTANSVIKLFDAAGYNATINITTASNVTLYTSGTGTIIKGIAFAPKSSSSPAISTTGSLTAFSTTYGTASTSQTISVSATNLTANISVTAPIGFEVSSDGSSYGSSATFTQSSGSASGTLYIRLSAAATVTGTYNSQNITLSSTGATSVNIGTASSGNAVSAKPITVTGISISNKIYDGNTSATVIGTAAYSGLANSESFSVIGTPSANFNNSIVGNGKSVNITGFVAPSNNYSIIQPSGLTADITAKGLTITGVSIQNKIYDGTTSATIVGTPSLVGVLTADLSNVSISGTPEANFVSADIANNVSVIITGYSLSGASSGNYSLSQPSGLTANITEAALQDQTISFGALPAVTYGDASLTLNASSNSGLTVIYSSSNIAVATVSGNTVTIVGAGNTTITATQSGNSSYNPATPVDQVLTVNQKTLTITGAVVSDKIYDATTTASHSGATLTGVLGSDQVNLSGSVSFDDANVGVGKSVTASFTINGTSSANYSLTQPTGLTANITAKNVTINGLIASNKVFDGNTSCSITGTPSLLGVIATDNSNVSLTGTATGTFASSSIGNGISVAISGLSLTGTASNNYSLTLPTLSANITEAPTTLAASDIAIIGYNTSGAPDNFAILVLKNLTSGTTFYVNDNELASTSATAFTDLAEGEASFTVKSGQNIPAGTVIVLPWGAAAVSSTTYDWSSTSGFGLGNNNEEIYIYTASSITATIPDAFIYFAKIGTSPSAIPSSLTAGTSAISPSGSALRYATSGATYNACKPTLLTAIGNTAANWNVTGATAIAVSDWTFTVQPTCPIEVNLSVSTASASEAATTSISITASATSAVSSDQTLTIAVSGTGITTGDYSISEPIITIPSGSTTGTVTLTITDDNAIEGTETATVTISNPSSGLLLGATTSQSITIADNDIATVVITPTGGGNAVTEGGATDTYSVVLSAAPTADVVVTGTPNTQVNIVPTVSIFTSSNWNTPQTVTVSAVDDNLFEGNHTGSIAYSVSSTDLSYNNISVASVAVSITDNDLAHTVAFARADTTISESSSSVKIWLKVTAVGNASGSVDLQISGASNATNSSDYTVSSTTLNIPANAVLNQLIGFDVTINDDVNPESDEYIICKLNNASGLNITTTGIQQHTLYIKDNDKTSPTASNQLNLNFVSSFSNGASGTNSLEISAFDSASKRIFVANSIGNKLDIINLANPSAPVLISSINLGVAPFNGAINSIDVFNGIVALALEGLTDKQANGKVVFTDINGTYLSEAPAGAMPDMITFNHSGTKVYTANEGEPNTAYTNDPVGSITVIDISGGVASPSATNIGFTAYNGQEATLRAQGIRIYGVTQPGSVPSTAAQDFEPEYITISDDDSKAWVTLQENNALVELDLTSNSVVKLIPLGYKDHSDVNNPFDVSDQTFGINLSNFNVKGMYEPDAISQFSLGGNVYLLTANEGDSRAYTGFSEETRVNAITLDPTAYPNASEIKNNAVLGRLTVTNKLGDTDNDGDIDQIYCLGGRSFSIWNPAAISPLVYDSKDDMERISSNNPIYKQFFNMSNTVANTAVKNRSDDKGPEPEGITVGIIGSRTYAFIALERIGGVMIYDITNPASPVYVTYANSRTIAGGDRGAEGIEFIPSSKSPNGKNLVMLSNEISSTLSVFEINPCAALGIAAIANAGGTSICSGGFVKLYNIDNNSTFTRQWLKDGVAITGATDSVYNATTSGSYRLVTFNSLGCVDTSAAIIITSVTQPTQPATACYETATFNSTTCQWDVTGTQPTQPSVACYQTATFNGTTCMWDVTGTQPAPPALTCTQTATWNGTTCQYDIITGTDNINPSIYLNASAVNGLGIKGMTSSNTPYIQSVKAGAYLKSLLTVDSTFTLLMNHELGSTAGITRAHGNKGAFVSNWVMRKSDLAVLSGSDLMTSVYGWNSTTQSSNTTPMTTSPAFNRFCSADLPVRSAFYNVNSGKGSTYRIFMHGEEGGSTGYQLATIANGPDKGKSYILGKFNPSTNGSGVTGVGAWENALACPVSQDKTIVIGLNDGGTPTTAAINNSVVVYVGNKQTTGSEVDKAGLTNGQLSYVKVTGVSAEISNTTTRATAITSGSTFTLDNTTSTKFSRPEDGGWDPSDPSKFYFVTTDQIDLASDGLGAQIGRSRLWRLNFTDISNPALGGTIDLLLDGTEGGNMYDNMTIDKFGHVILQEDPGDNHHNAKVWQYTIATDQLTMLAKHDVSRFGDVVSGTTTTATSPYNKDEESSGVIDMSDILGNGYFLMVDQAHYTTGLPTANVEGGQLLMMFNPASVSATASTANDTVFVSTTNCAGASGVSLGTPATGDNCGVASVTNNAPSTFPVGNTTVTWTVTDVNGNTNTATQIVVVTLTQPTQPTTACYQTATFNSTTCQWDLTGVQPAAPTGLACWQSATFNNATCSWDVIGSEPVQPTTACWQTATFNTATCSWVLTGTQPANPVITATGSTTICGTATVTLTSSVAASGTVSLQWMKNGVAIAGANATTLVVNNTAALSTGAYSVVRTIGACTNTSNTINVTGNPAPVVTANGPTSFCTGSSVVLTSSITPSGTQTLQWFKGTAAITGETGATLTVTSATALGTGSYTVKVTQGTCVTASNAIAVTVNALPAASVVATATAGASTTLCGSATLNIKSSVLPSATATLT
ncbi:MAG: hypothetical protein EBS34_03515, partial [Flavobacteriales bacterium]|nr:hypothetical protein [Flavobacteriales bacterium]